MLAVLKALDVRKLALYFIGLTFFALPISISAASVFYILTVAAVLFSGRWQEKWEAIASNPVTYWLWGFGLLILIGVLYSSGQPHFIKHDLYKHLWVFLTPLFFWVCSKDHDRRLVLRFFLAAMMLVMLLSYMKYFHLIPMQSYWVSLFHLQNVGGRATVFQSHISQGFFLAFAAGCWFHYFVIGSERKWWCLFLSLAAGVDVLFLNSGRTGFIVYLLLMLFLFFNAYGIKKSLVCSLILLVFSVFAFFLSTDLHNRLEDIGKNAKVQGTSVGLRVAMLENGWKVFKQRPLFGYGTGGFSAGYASLPQKDIDKTKPNATHTGLLPYTLENSFMNIMIEYGAVGLLFVLAFIVALWRYALQLVSPYDVFTQGFLLAFFAGAMGTAFFSSGYSKHAFSIMLALAYGGLVIESKTKLISRLKFSLVPD